LIPTQFIYPKDFGAATETGIDSDFSTALHNVSDVILVFPKRALDLTCYENPMLLNLQLNINNRLYPEKAVSTIGGRFFQMMLNASDLEGAFECTDEYEDSLTRPLNDDAGIRYDGCFRDQTSFICTIQTERNAEGCFFDGLESGNANVRVAIHGDPIEAGDNTYWVPDKLRPTEHPLPPQAWFCQKSYWRCDPVNGLIYMKSGVPSNLASEADQTITRN
jgi:hypothetical protein